MIPLPPGGGWGEGVWDGHGVGVGTHLRASSNHPHPNPPPEGEGADGTPLRGGSIQCSCPSPIPSLPTSDLRTKAPRVTTRSPSLRPARISR